jgi:hypothetical protein
MRTPPLTPPPKGGEIGLGGAYFPTPPKGGKTGLGGAYFPTLSEGGSGGVPDHWARWRVLSHPLGGGVRGGSGPLGSVARTFPPSRRGGQGGFRAIGLGGAYFPTLSEGETWPQGRNKTIAEPAIRLARSRPTFHQPSLVLRRFEEVGLAESSTDYEVWNVCQAEQLIWYSQLCNR